MNSIAFYLIMSVAAPGAGPIAHFLSPMAYSSEASCEEAAKAIQPITVPQVRPIYACMSGEKLYQFLSRFGQPEMIPKWVPVPEKGSI